jgi:hypothetical protein
VSTPRSFPALTNSWAACERRGSPWGIITNKAQRFTLPLLNRLGLCQARGLRRQWRFGAARQAGATADAAGLQADCQGPRCAAFTLATICATSRPAVRRAWSPWRYATVILAMAIPIEAWGADHHRRPCTRNRRRGALNRLIVLRHRCFAIAAHSWGRQIFASSAVSAGASCGRVNSMVARSTDPFRPWRA